MNVPVPRSIRVRLTSWYVSVLAVLLLIYAATVFVFQYATLTTQIFQDESRNIEKVEGLLSFDASGALQLPQQDEVFSQSHLTGKRMIEVLDRAGKPLYRSPNLRSMSLGGPSETGEGVSSFTERIVRLDDGRLVFLTSRIYDKDGHALLIRLGCGLLPLRGLMLQFLVTLLVSLPVALAIAVFAGQWIAERALRPFDEIAVGAEGIIEGDLRDRLAVQNPADELGHLARVFNHLLQRLEQAFVQMQRFTLDAAHELRTPLASMRMAGETALRQGQGAASYETAIRAMLDETARLNETVDGLLLLVRAETTHTSPDCQIFAIGELVNEVLGLLAVLIEERQVSVMRQGRELGKTSVRADRALLRTALLNVLHNALKFSPAGSTLTICYIVPPEAPNRIRVAIEDEGPGLTFDERQRVFERFFRGEAKPQGFSNGPGLGLAISKLVIERLDGSIRFDDAATGGARCIIDLVKS